MDCTLISAGAAQEVTGSKHILEIDGTTIMIDCGAFQGKREEAYRKNCSFPFDPTRINAVVLTHAHYDHCGLLPRLVAEGYDNSIYTTHATRDLANLVLLDSAHLQKRDMEYLRKQPEHHSGKTVHEPLYSEKEVRICLDHFMTVAYHRPFYLAKGVNAMLFDAGHILGSSMALVDVNRDGEHLQIGFSGDMGRRDLPIIRDPEMLPPVDYLVLESTYGNRLHAPLDTTMDTLADIINRTVERGGKIIIPAFAIERTQELVFCIHLLHDQGRIPALPIYVDSPMAVNATTIFKLHEECYDDETREAFLEHHENPFGFNDLHYCVSKQQSQALNMITDPAIIIASSGMCEAGRILHHLIHNISDDRNTIMIVGYMAEHTLGRKILEKWESVPIFGKHFQLRAEVAVLNSFSGHADYNEITDYVGRLDTTNLKKIFLVHGEQKAQENLRDLLAGMGHAAEIVAPGVRYGLVTI
jgi:metallo-beta-lactamase family protein